jgi:restriction system protein
MAIPDYQTLMLPVLQSGAAGEVSVRDAIDRLAKEFKLTDAERAELLPSGKQAIFTNRVQWAKTYLVKAPSSSSDRTIRSWGTTADRSSGGRSVAPAGWRGQPIPASGTPGSASTASCA